MFYLCMCLIFFLSIARVKCQTGRVSSDGRYYICVLPGNCPTGSIIDPRIVTPGGGGGGGTGGGGDNSCPAGYFPCYGINTQCGRRSVSNVSTGDGTATEGAYPWQAYLRNTSSFAGSGVLLDEYHVLTAAHKVANYVSSPTSLFVIMGVYNPNAMVNTQNAYVSRITVHPSYDRVTLKNDLALLTLSTPIVLGVQNTVNKACLPASGTSFVGQNCVVSGWGQTAFTSNDAPTTPMKQVNVRIVSYATCRASMALPAVLGSNVDVYLDPNGEICAGGEANKDACTQDGGSPLVCPNSDGNFSVAGLVIWGRNCGMPGVYGVYVSVPYYSNWVTSTVAATR